MDPADSAREILDLQAAHQVVAENAAAFRTVLDHAAADAVESYLNQNWQLPAHMAGLLWPRRWYRKYLEEVENGQLRIRNLLAAAAELRRLLSAANADVLQSVGATIAALLATPELHDLLHHATRKSSVARREFDQLARDRAKPTVTGLLGCLGSVEAMLSLAIATTEHGWCYPTPGERVVAKGLFHPFLGQHAVRNDVDLDHEVRVCFVTGPNMAGKSTFLKAVAVAIFLAHLGCGVPATSMEFTPVGSIFSSVEIVDNLAAGESFYLAEVRRIRALALALSEHGSVVAVVDEPFRGTNVHDAAEATLATITRIADHPGALVFVASHVGEVVPAILQDRKIRLMHFAADIHDDLPSFDYRLRPGVSLQRLGMTLLRQEGVLEILERASKSAKVL